MASEIVIKGNKVTLREYSDVKSVPLQVLIDKLREQFVASTPIIPRSVVTYATKGSLVFYVIEEEPRERELKLKAGPRGSSGKIYTRTLEIPWVYHVVEFYRAAFERFSVFFSPKKIQFLNDPLFYAPLGNIGKSSVVCTGDALSIDVRGTLDKKLKEIVRSFWESEFNFDLSDIYRAGMPEEIQALTEEMLGKNEKRYPRDPLKGSWYIGWEKLSKKQGFDICTLSWKPVGASLGEIIDRRAGREED